MQSLQTEEREDTVSYYGDVGGACQSLTCSMSDIGGGLVMSAMGCSSNFSDTRVEGFVGRVYRFAGPVLAPNLHGEMPRNRLIKQAPNRESFYLHSPLG